MTNERTDRRGPGRTRLWTTASIVAVAAAGALAVGANMGILSAAGDNSDVGTLSAADDLIAADESPSVDDAPPAEPQVVDVYLDTPAGGESVAANPAALGAVEAFTIDAAGDFSFRVNDTQLRLDTVAPAAGWTWELTQSVDGELAMTLTDGVRTLAVAATLGEDGRVALVVTEPTAAPDAAEPAVVLVGDDLGADEPSDDVVDDEYEDDSDDDQDDDHEDEDDDEDEDEDEHEGRDDDD